MLTTTEARAHLTIADTLAQVLDCRMHYNTALAAMWKPLEVFAPRCNCRRVLTFGPWRDGSRQVICRCGAVYWEAQIWRGVPKVELAAHARR